MRKFQTLRPAAESERYEPGEIVLGGLPPRKRASQPPEEEIPDMRDREWQPHNVVRTSVQRRVTKLRVATQTSGSFAPWFLYRLSSVSYSLLSRSVSAYQVYQLTLS